MTSAFADFAHMDAESGSTPARAAAPAAEVAVRHFRQVLLWPLRLMRKRGEASAVVKATSTDGECSPVGPTAVTVAVTSVPDVYGPKLADKVVGAITSSAPGIAMGFIRREVDPPAPAVVEESPVEIREIVR